MSSSISNTTIASNSRSNNNTTNTSTTSGITQATRSNTSNTYTHNNRNNNSGNNGTYRTNNNNNRMNNTSIFKGETTDMNGNVFQTHAEQKKRGQFQDTMDALKVYSSTTFRKDINHLTKLFTELKKPEVPRPPDPVTIEQVDDTGKKKQVITQFSQTVFQEQVKMWIKDESSLRATTQSLYNIVWGQCSKLMQNKLKAVKNFQDI